MMNFEIVVPILTYAPTKVVDALTKAEIAKATAKCTKDIAHARVYNKSRYKKTLKENQKKIKTSQRKDLQLPKDDQNNSRKTQAEFDQADLQKEQKEVEYYQKGLKNYKSISKQWKEKRLKELEERKNNITLVFNLVTMGINQKTFDYIKSTAAHYAEKGKPVNIAVQITPNYENVNKVPIAGTMNNDQLEALEDFAWQIEDERLSTNGFLGIRHLADDTNFTIDQLKSTNRFVNKAAFEIHKKNLTPFEAALFTHKFCAQFFYNSENQYYGSCALTDVVSSGNIICTGYAALYKAICDKANLPGFDCKLLNSDKILQPWAHSLTLVTLDDAKYDIKGTFFDDPTWDAKNKQNRTNPTFALCLAPLADYNKLKAGKTAFLSVATNTKSQYASNFNSRKITDTPFWAIEHFVLPPLEHAFLKNAKSPVISLKTFEQGLKNTAIKFGKTPQQAQKMTKETIKLTAQKAIDKYAPRAKNCFYQYAIEQELKPKTSSNSLGKCITPQEKTLSTKQLQDMLQTKHYKNKHAAYKKELNARMQDNASNRKMIKNILEKDIEF